MKYALFSCYDKNGIEQFAKFLEVKGYKILSTGGTLKYLLDSGVNAIDVSEYTHFKDMLSGRVKTLHPAIHAGILYRRENTTDVKELLENGFKAIDIVVNNLYPFKETYLNTDDIDEIIEKIDIGGPSMIRATAKNYKYTTIITDCSQMELVQKEIEDNGNTTLETRKFLAGEAFNLTANYDAWIAKFFNEENNIKFPKKYTIALENKEHLRYGENPHQEAYVYDVFDGLDNAFKSAILHQGKELSFNNYNDASAAMNIIRLFENPACVAIKHANPCGVCESDNLFDAYMGCYSADSESIFGGIVALNGEVNKEIAEKLVEIFLEIIIAPKFSKEALEVLKTKKNLRVLEIPNLMKSADELDIKFASGKATVQELDFIDDNNLKVVTKKSPSEKELEDLLFAEKVVKNAKSNAVVIVKDKKTIGIGLGSVNRFFAVNAALKQSGDLAKGSVLASDGFFPFDDCVRLLAESGITSILQPGGSIKDQISIDACDELGLSMVFTGQRHFKH